MAITNATNVKIGMATTESDSVYNPFAHLETASLSFSNSLIDVTTKSSGSWKEMISGQRSWGMSGDGKLDYAALADHVDVVGAGGTGTVSNVALAGTKVFVQFYIGTQGYKGEAFISQFDQNAGTDDAPTYSISLDGTGILAFDADLGASD